MPGIITVVTEREANQMSKRAIKFVMECIELTPLSYELLNSCLGSPRSTSIFNNPWKKVGKLVVLQCWAMANP